METYTLPPPKKQIERFLNFLRGMETVHAALHDLRVVPPS